MGHAVGGTGTGTSTGSGGDGERLLVGVDFTSAPTARKPIRLAFGRRRGAVVQLARQEGLTSLAAFEAWLAGPGPWLGGFDLPFGLPRELVETLGWPTDWAPLIAHYAALSRAEIRDTFAAFCDARPAGRKFAHRACDGPAGSSPSMKWVNPPVAYMLHAGVPRLVAAGVHLPGLHGGDPARVALEAYPGLLARELIGARSYKSDDRAKQTPERLIARKDLIEALEQGRSRLGLRLKLTHAQRDELADDGSGDKLDAVLCLMQAAWADGRADYGQPADMDTLEGWIVGA
ncbi:DUF429 domain-containing protein [Mitsuaria sp. GD03876]|uniref:DUF429 domain-containing protein n=1 Tax=Mitsuaria sp. GD03876 TaxID=2975399 RepID=UPI00244C0018|nr:DUF429 domain-containing protein [Mitsuaria sp. GD03876]MDH0868056.1 DUF429 domain-containing protein [Mitsuaria sp. GD03876]